jgi:hypothetical protein
MSNQPPKPPSRIGNAAGFNFHRRRDEMRRALKQMHLLILSVIATGLVLAHSSRWSITLFRIMQ